MTINEKAEDVSYENWLKVINLNLNGVFLVAQAVGRQMIKQGYGSIINTSGQCHKNKHLTMHLKQALSC